LTLNREGVIKMVLKLYRGETCLRTIYNVVKISSEEYGALIVKQKTNEMFFTNCYKFNKDYHRFIISVD